MDENVYIENNKAYVLCPNCGLIELIEVIWQDNKRICPECYTTIHQLKKKGE